jgi:hypothetical protein
VLREHLKVSVSEKELLKGLSVVLNNVLNDPLARVSEKELLSVVLNHVLNKLLSSASVFENVALNVVLNPPLNEPLASASVSENVVLRGLSVTLKELLENVRLSV